MIINCTSSQQIHANQSQLLLLRQQSALSSSSSSSASVEQQHHHHHPLQQHLAYLQVVQATQQQQHLPYYYVEPSCAPAPTPPRVAKRVPPQYPAPVSCYYNHNHHPHHHSRLAQPPPQDRTGGLHEATGSGTPPTMDGGHNPLRLNNILYEDNNNHVSTVKVDRSRRGIVFHRFLSSSS